MKLSPRLELILNHLNPGEPVWDVCCDHGILGRSAIRKNIFSEVHFVDQVVSIMQRLSSEIIKFRPEFILKTGEEFITRYQNSEKWDEELNQQKELILSAQQIPVFLWTTSAPLTTEYWSGNVVIAGVGSQLILEFLNSYLDNKKSDDTQKKITFFLCPQKDIHDLEINLPLGFQIKEKIHFKEKHRDRILYILTLSPDN